MFRVPCTVLRLCRLPRLATANVLSKQSDGAAFVGSTIGLKYPVCDSSSPHSLQLLTLLRCLHTSSVMLNGMVEIACPAFAESISEGDIKLTKRKGDSVNQDDLIATIETDKTTVEVRAPQSGVIEEVLADDGTTVKPHQILFKLKPGAGGGSASAAKPADAPPPPPPPPPKPSKQESAPPPPPPQKSAAPAPSSEPRPVPSSPPPAPPRPDKPMRSTPVSQIKPAPAPAAAAPPSSGLEKAITGSRTETRVKMNRMRQRIATRLKDAQNTYAMLTTFNEIDMSTAIALRNRYKDAFTKKHGLKFGFMSPFVKAAAYALQDQPVVNAVIDENEIVYRHFVDISVAVATPKGLVVPVLRNVEGMNFAQIEREIASLGDKAKDGKLAIEDMEGGTFTISNGGVFGSLYGTPIINPPQSAILGMHAINDRPMAINGKVEIRPMMVVALTYDHRLIDGREAVTFLKKIKQCVEDPSSMLLDL